MAGIQNIFDISGRAMSAQLTRLNTVASNLANAKSFAGSKEEAFVAIKPVFETEYATHAESSGIASVNVSGIVTSDCNPNGSTCPVIRKLMKEVTFGDLQSTSRKRWSKC